MRPHDLELHADDPGRRGRRGRITRVTRVGFEVRVDVATRRRSRCWSPLTRTEFQALGIDVGSEVYVRLTPGAPVVAATPGSGATEPDPDPVLA